MTIAVVADALGPIENYTLRAYDPGPPGPGEVRIAVKAAGVSFVDVLNAAGNYQSRAPVPFIPGSEFAGTIEALGQGVSGLEEGQPVMASAWGGAWADAAVVTAASVNPIPGDMSFAEAAVFKVSTLTAWHALADRAALKAGETLLVLGAGGATGHAAVQVGHYLGARVIASTSSQEKHATALAGGADAVVETTAAEWRKAVIAANADRSVDVVFDPVGGDATEAAFRCLGWNGRHLVIGFPRGIANLPTNLPLLREASLVGVNLQQHSLAQPEQAAKNIERLLSLAGEGLFRPVIARELPLAQFAEAMRGAASGSSAGRIVLTMG